MLSRKVIAIWNDNVFEAGRLKRKLDLLGLKSRIIDMLNEDLKKQYIILYSERDLKELLEE